VSPKIVTDKRIADFKSRAITEKLLVVHVIKTFFTIYRTRRTITVLKIFS